ncbi:hypothetical protein KCP70_19125 [Salmonella enterica subsp. enterica]|nr:hypothetical protein KCP70_19125 [Salmonella enterica subsp. enterica]
MMGNDDLKAETSITAEWPRLNAGWLAGITSVPQWTTHKIEVGRCRCSVSTTAKRMSISAGRTCRKRSLKVWKAR